MCVCECEEQSERRNKPGEIHADGTVKIQRPGERWRRGGGGGGGQEAAGQLCIEGGGSVQACAGEEEDRETQKRTSYEHSLTNSTLDENAI